MNPRAAIGIAVIVGMALATGYAVRGAGDDASEELAQPDPWADIRVPANQFQERPRTGQPNPQQAAPEPYRRPEPAPYQRPQPEQPAPQPQTYQQAPAQQADAGTVYLSETGSKYHRQTCRTLKTTRTPINVAEAESQGYEACKVCNP